LPVAIKLKKASAAASVFKSAYVPIWSSSGKGSLQPLMA
jgi:hypothetical protein